MNLDDLRSELRARAGDLDPSASGRMAGIRAKAAQRRRRKATGIVAATVLVVGAGIGVPVVSNLSAGPEPAQLPDRSEPFPEQVDGNTRIAYELGDPRDDKVTLRFTPDDTDLLLDFACDGLARHNRENGTSYRLAVTVSSDPTSGVIGGSYSTDYCVPGEGAGGGPYLLGADVDPDQARARWRQLRLGRGDPVTIKLVVANATKRVREAIAGRIGVAVYEMPDAGEGG